MNDFSLISIVKLLHAWRKPIVYVTISGGVVSAVLSLVVPVYYESTTIFYAASEDLFKPSKVFGYTDSEVDYYGTTDDIQRILTVATSYELTDFLIDSFDLYTEYNIDPSKPKASFKVREKLLNRYDVVRTKYDAIELTFEDRSPELAAALATTARTQIEAIISEVIRGSQKNLIDSYAKAINEKEELANEIYDSLSRYQVEYGILDADAQTELMGTLILSARSNLEANEGRLESYRAAKRSSLRDSIIILEGMIAGYKRQLNALEGLAEDSTANNMSISQFNAGKGRISFLNDAFTKAVNKVNTDRELLKSMESAYTLKVPAVHVVEEAQVPLVKSRPKRTLLVAMSTITVFLFMVIGVLFIESYRHQDWTFLREW